jgi:UDPglucose--hexose-1-phosphate uridylyltransferase
LTEKQSFVKVFKVIAFKKIVQQSTYLNPFNNFLPFEGKIEIRWDPLTNLTSRIVHFPARKLERFNCEHVVKASLDADCPFCPQNVETMTSKFDKEIYGFERLEEDGITIIPNVLTFDKYCLVAIITKEHFVDMKALTESGCIVKGIKVLLDVLRIIREQDPKVKYFSINCNYMPMSGSSLLHPHIQAIAGEYPTNYHGIMVEASEAFFLKHHRVFWDVLAEEETALSERFISRIGSTFWYTPFAPKGNIDIGCIFDKDSFFDLEESDLHHFNEGLSKVLMYLDRENVAGFNLSLFSGIYGGRYFRTNMRMIARRFLPPTNAADSNYFDKIHMENACLFFPEDVSDSIRTQW